MYCQRHFRHTNTDSLSGLIIFRGCVVFILTYLKAARFHLAGKNPPPPWCNDSLQCPQLAVDRASPTRRVIWSTPSFQQQICERISNISHFYSCPRAGTFESHLCFFSSIPAVSLTRQQDLTGRLARQACPAGLPSRLPLLVRQAFSAGRQACPAGCPAGYLCLSGRLSLQDGRLVQQACPADHPCKSSGFLCRPAGLSSRLPSRLPLLVRQAFPASRQACPAGSPAGYLCSSGRLSLQAGRQADRLLPQDLIRKASPTRLPFQDFLLKISRGWALPCAGSSLLQLATCLQ